MNDDLYVEMVIKNDRILDFVKRSFSPYRVNATKSENHAIVAYRDLGDYAQINSFSRGLTIDGKLDRSGLQVSQVVKDISSYLNKGKSPYEVVSYRGIGRYKSNDNAFSSMKSFKIGDSFTDMGFSSSSLNRDIADNWVELSRKVVHNHDENFLGEVITIKINSKKGSNIAFLDEQSPSVMEILHNKGTIFTVTAKAKRKGSVMVNGKEVPKYELSVDAADSLGKSDSDDELSSMRRAWESKMQSSIMRFGIMNDDDIVINKAK